MKVVIQLDPWSTKTELDSHSQSLYISFTAVAIKQMYIQRPVKWSQTIPVCAYPSIHLALTLLPKTIASWHGTATTVRLTLICNQST